MIRFSGRATSAYLSLIFITAAAHAGAHAPRPAGDPISGTVAYTASFDTAHPHDFGVAITVVPVSDAPVAFEIPAWTPGYYQILHFERGISGVTALSSGSPVPVTHDGERRWSVAAPAGRPVTLRYRVKASDDGLGFFGSALDTSAKHAYINGASAFMYPVGAKDHHCRLTVTTPEGWRIENPLPAVIGAAPSGPAAATFMASDYDELIDCPVQAGEFNVVDAADGGVKYTCLIVGNQPDSTTELPGIIRSISRATLGIFKRAPFRKYQFIFHCGGPGFYGGLEHRNSTVIHLPRSVGDIQSDGFVDTTAHEFFHAWNVKRLHPIGLGPFDYTQPVRSGSVWWAEGVTDYYALVIMLRSGMRDSAWFLRDVAQRMESLDGNPSRLKVSLDEASRRAWEGGSEGFGGLSYYLKGSLVGFYLDARIRAVTGGAASLDDVMRSLDHDYGARGLPYPDSAILEAIDHAAGPGLAEEYRQLVMTPGEVDWNRALDSVGLTLKRTRSPFLGVRAAGDQPKEGMALASVMSGSPAAAMGLQAGDIIVEVDGAAVSSDSLSAALGKLAPGAEAHLKVDRAKQTVLLHGQPGFRSNGYTIAMLPDAKISPSVRAARSGLLRQSPGFPPRHR